MHLLETLVASPVDHEPAGIIRDKLQFLQVGVFCVVRVSNALVSEFALMFFG